MSGTDKKNRIRRKRPSLSREVWRRFKKSKTGMLGLIILLVFAFFAVFAGIIGNEELITKINPSQALQGPSVQHIFGTDNLGRDLFTRMLFGSRISLSMGIVVVAISYVVGSLIGAAVGYYGGFLDNAVMRIFDVLNCLPPMLLIVVIVVGFGTGLMNLLLAMSVGSIPMIARTVRSQVMNLTDMVKAQVYGYAYNNKVWNDEYQGFYGAKLSMTPEAGALSVEYARAHSGDRLIKESHDNAYLVKVDGVLNMDAFTPRAAFIYQKGSVSDYGAYAPGLVYGKTYFGNDLTDVLAESRIFNVGVDYTWNKMTFALDGFAFQDRTAQHAATLEADLTATYQHNENVGLFAGIGYAKLSRADFDRSDATVYQAGVNVKF